MRGPTLVGTLIVMRHPRLPARFLRYCLHSGILFPTLLSAARAQTAIPSAPVQSVPAATPVPANSVPSMPVPTEQGKQVPNAAPQQPVAVPAPSPMAAKSVPAEPPYDPSSDDGSLGSPYIPVDSTIYPMALRLYSLGYLDTSFINMRPWTRRSLLHMLNASQSSIMADGNDEAVALLAGLRSAIADETPGPGLTRGEVYGLDTVYTRLMGISGTTLRDSYHLGQTIANDYGRPYEPGFNSLIGFSTINEVGRFSLYVRGEYQHAPSAAGYSAALSNQLSTIDQIPFSGFNLNQATIPTGPIAAQNPFRLQEATLSVHLLGHEISGGKSDAWLAPTQGGAMAWSNNAENIYSFRINRVEPLHIPLLSRLTGPFRYDFFVGSLKGHTYPNSPWIHSETVSFAPTANVRIAFERAVIWGGEGHEPVTLHTFLRSFFNFNDTTGAVKTSAQDPGARFSTFNFSWRLPFLTHHVTLYADSMVHDDVTPPSAPRRSAYRPGVYLSQVPGLPKLDFRVEAASTDTSTLVSQGGGFMYIEAIQRQGYTNKGYILGDWIGREAKGGQAWLTYHLSANEWIQLEYMNKKTPKDFIPGGTTQNQFMIDVVKRLRKDIELNAWYQYESWKAPVYIPGNGVNKDSTVAFQVTWFPRLRTKPEQEIAPAPVMH